MPVEAVLIGEPAIDFTSLVSLCHKALGYSPASAADASHRKFSTTEKLLSILASLRDEKAPAGITPNLLSFADFLVLVIADDRDLLDILELSAGMPFVRAETVARGVEIAVMKGSLAQWRDAVKSGTTPTAEPSVRALYSKILLLFEKQGLSSVWSDCDRRPAPDHSGFYLEDKRR